MEAIDTTPPAVDTVRTVTNRKGRQKTLIVDPEIVGLLVNAVELLKRAGLRDYSEARLIRNCIRGFAGQIAEQAASDAMQTRTGISPSDTKRIRREVDDMRKLMIASERRAQQSED